MLRQHTSLCSGVMEVPAVVTGRIMYIPALPLALVLIIQILLTFAFAQCASIQHYTVYIVPLSEEGDDLKSSTCQHCGIDNCTKFLFTRKATT